MNAMARLPWIDQRRVGLSLGAVAFGLIVWYVASTYIKVSVLFPSPIDTANAFAHQVRSGEFLPDWLRTVVRLIVGFSLGSALGAAGGIAMGSSWIIRRALEPYVHFFRFITPIAWVAPAAVWFGVGQSSLLFLVVYATAFVVLLNTMAGALSVRRDRIWMARSFGAGWWQVFAGVTVPSTVRYALIGMRVGMANAFGVLIAAEMLVGSNGIGYLIFNSRTQFRADVMFAGIVAVGLTGFAADQLFVWLQQRLLGRYARG